MAMKNRLELLLDLAYLYYEKGETMTSISEKRANLSTAHVARLLKEAKEEGIVTINFTPPPMAELGWKLVSKFGGSLRKAIVVPSIGDPSAKLTVEKDVLREIDDEFDLNRQILARAAAEHFESLVESKEGKKAKTKRTLKVCLSCGYTLYQMILSLRTRSRDIEIYPAALMGRGPVINHLSAQVLVALLWAKCDDKATAYMGSLPPLDRDLSALQAQEQYRNWLEGNGRLREVIEEVMSRTKQADVVFTSIGALRGPASPYKPRTHLTTMNLLSEFGLTQAKLKKSEIEIAGSICYSFFDKDGKIPEGSRYFLSIEVDQLRTMVKDPSKDVVVIAGRYKEEALRIVLEQEWCSTLITDTYTARWLLNEKENED